MVGDAPRDGENNDRAPVATLRIDALAHGGAGVGTWPGHQKRCFVDGALPGEVIRAELWDERKRYGKARVLEVQSASPARVEPPCAIAQECGGCNWQHVEVGQQAKLKAEIALGQLRGLITEFDQIIPAPRALGYRRRARLQLQLQGDKLVVGFFAARERRVVALESCPVLVPELQASLPKLARLDTWLKPVLSKKPSLQIHLLAADGQVALGIAGFCPPVAQKEALWAELSAWAPIVGVEFRGGRQSLRVGTCRLVLDRGPGMAGVLTSPFDFAQAQSEQNRALCDTVMRYAKAHKQRVLELFCGAGNFSRYLGQEAKFVHAWDEARAAISELIRYSQKSGAPISAQRGRVEQALKLAMKRAEQSAVPVYDRVLLDPPRSGAGQELSRQIAALAAERIVYISCDPATLARDLRVMVERGYVIAGATLVDMMPMTSEIEMVVALDRIDSGRGGGPGVGPRSGPKSGPRSEPVPGGQGE